MSEVFVFSPDGKRHSVSKANAHDLVSNLGWAYDVTSAASVLLKEAQMSEVTVYSPDGERQSVSKANARDLVSNAGWTYAAAGEEAKPSKTPTQVGSILMSGHPISEQIKPEEAAKLDVVKTETDYAEEQQVLAQNANRAVGKFTIADFADLAEKGDVVDYITKTFPDAKVDGRLNREKLVAFGIELAVANQEPHTLSNTPNAQTAPEGIEKADEQTR